MLNMACAASNTHPLTLLQPGKRPRVRVYASMNASLNNQYQQPPTCIYIICRGTQYAALCKNTLNQPPRFRHGNLHPTHITEHSLSGRPLSFCFFSDISPRGSLLLLLWWSFFPFLLFLRVSVVSFCSLAGLLGSGGVGSWLSTELTIMIGSSVAPASVMASLSLLPRPVNLDRVSDNRPSPLWLVGRLFVPPSHVRDPRREADKKPVLDSSAGVGGSVRPRDMLSNSSIATLLRRLLDMLVRPTGPSEATDSGCMPAGFTLSHSPPLSTSVTPASGDETRVSLDVRDDNATVCASA